ncbi:MAG: TetR/AcrR family transcriptional repressor of nem operon [Parvicellaceae bacterium]|jgi:TetR/AcrR family transcriptional repressor of nem operon
MATKAEITTQYIIEKVAPVFNKRGFFATSMADITKVTGLTKGAIYGNFENKEHLAIEVFNYNIRKIVWKVADEINHEVSAEAKLKAMTNFYRKYYVKTLEFGGCPLLNVGVDTNNLNAKLHQRVTTVLGKLQNNIAQIIEEGKANGEFKTELDPVKLGARFISQIQGAIFSSVMMKDPLHIVDMMEYLDAQVDNELMK